MHTGEMGQYQDNSPTPGNRPEIHAKPILGEDGLLLDTGHSRSGISFIARISGPGGLLNPLSAEGLSASGEPLVDVLKSALRSSHRAHKTIIHPFDRGRTNPLVLLDQIRDSPPLNMSLLHLDYYRSKDPIASTNLQAVLLSMPPRVVAAQFGIECLTWCASNLGENFRSAGGLRAFFQEQGVNLTSLEKSIKAVDHWLVKRHPSRGETMAINYALLQLHNTDDVNDLANPRVLFENPIYHIKAEDPEASKSGVFPTSRVPQYSLRAGCARGTKAYGDEGVEARATRSLSSGWQRSWPVYFDALLGFVLEWNGIPQAVVSGLASDPETFFIVQVHGVKGYLQDPSGKGADQEGNPYRRLPSRGLIGLRWEEMMVDIVEQYALALGFTRLGLLGAANNQWLGSERNPARRFNFRSAEERYDALAVEHAWTYSNRDSNYYKPIRQKPRFSGRYPDFKEL